MKKQHFDKLMESVRQADRVVAGEATPSRTTSVPAYRVKRIRQSLNLSQEEFARLVHVGTATIRNWEQGRRHPDGAAIALLTAIENDPENVIAAINA